MRLARVSRDWKTSCRQAMVALILGGAPVLCAQEPAPLLLRPGEMIEVGGIFIDRDWKVIEYRTNLVVSADGTVEEAWVPARVPLGGLDLVSAAAVLETSYRRVFPYALVRVKVLAPAWAVAVADAVARTNADLYIRLVPDPQRPLGWLFLGEDPGGLEQGNAHPPFAPARAVGDFWMPGEYQRHLERKLGLTPGRLRQGQPFEPLSLPPE